MLCYVRTYACVCVSNIVYKYTCIYIYIHMYVYLPKSSKVMKHAGVTASHSECQAEGATWHQIAIGRNEMDQMMGVKTFE